VPQLAGCTLDIGICAFFMQWGNKRSEISFLFTQRDLTVACSHYRSYKYFNDSLKNGCNFKSALCKSWGKKNKKDY
jgi:hypothetical protein